MLMEYHEWNMLHEEHGCFFDNFSDTTAGKRYFVTPLNYGTIPWSLMLHRFEDDGKKVTLWEMDSDRRGRRGFSDYAEVFEDALQGSFNDYKRDLKIDVARDVWHHQQNNANDCAVFTVGGIRRTVTNGPEKL